MKKHFLSVMLPVFMLMIVLSGCGSPPAPAVNLTQTLPPATITTTSDPCSKGQIEAAVQRVNRHMREFDDAHELADHLPQAQLTSTIADMQKIRREAQDEQIPACLTILKADELDHMNTVTTTFLTFMSASNPGAIDCTKAENNREAQIICQGPALASQQHDKYLLELARLLGLTVVPATQATVETPVVPSETPTP